MTLRLLEKAHDKPHGRPKALTPMSLVPRNLPTRSKSNAKLAKPTTSHAWQGVPQAIINDEPLPASRRPCHHRIVSPVAVSGPEGNLRKLLSKHDVNMVLFKLSFREQALIF